MKKIILFALFLAPLSSTIKQPANAFVEDRCVAQFILITHIKDGGMPISGWGYFNQVDQSRCIRAYDFMVQNDIQRQQLSKYVLDRVD